MILFRKTHKINKTVVIIMVSWTSYPKDCTFFTLLSFFIQKGSKFYDSCRNEMHVQILKQMNLK